MRLTKVLSGERESFFEGYKLALKNAKELLKSAKLVAENKNYGIANSLLVLAAEERIKAFEFLKRSMGAVGNQTIPLYKHKEKHKYIWNIRHIKYWSDEFGEIFAKVILRKYFKKAPRKLSKQKKVLSKNEIRQWYNKADSKKKLGFYVDKKEGKWNIPSQIKKTEFDKSVLIVRDTFKIITEFEERINESK